MAEALAFGSLLLEGTDVRLAGPGLPAGDVLPAPLGARRLTRPAPSTSPWPACRRRSRASFWVYDSLLSEYAALGFEYGYSTVHTDALVAWEAQFGDFGNGAQIVIDQFIAAAEAKWGQTLGPGAAPAPRLRGPGPGALLGPPRAVPHPVRRRQPAGRQRHHRGAVLPRPAPPGPPAVRRPLVVLTPKSLLRAHTLPVAGRRAGHRPVPRGARRPRLRRRSTHAGGGSDRDAVRRVVLASGKVALRRHRPPRRARPAGGGRAGRAALPVAGAARARHRRPATRPPPRWCGSRRSRRTWAAWTFVHSRLHRLLPRAAAAPPRQPAGVGQPRQRAATPSTSASRPTSSSGPSTACEARGSPLGHAVRMLD